MISSLKFILSTQLKRSGINKKISGFTLIELLVALVLAFLVITPLMTFMISILRSDRQEQAKANTEQDIQAAVDYITRDLEQAIYIYDTDGLTRNNNTTNFALSGIQDQIPPVAPASGCNATNASNCQPILVFWKREFAPNSVGVNSASDTTTDDSFVYSLVAYYLITNPNPNSTSPWSPSARIGRFQIRGNVNAANANAVRGTACDPGFSPPPLAQTVNGSSLKDKMDQWKNGLGTACSTSVASSTTYTQQVLTLVDYVSTSSPAVTCSFGQGIGTNTNGFYTCVDSTNVFAQIYLRGNAFVRLNNNNSTAYTSSNSAYFPSVSVQVQGRGFLNTSSF